MALQDWMKQLETPIEAGLSKGDLQTQYNQMRKQIQGGWGAGTEALKGQLGQRGFRVGESGVADTALAGLYGEGARALSTGAENIYLDEAKRRQDLAGLNLQRMLGAGGLEAQQAATGASAGASADRLAWEKEQFGQTFPWQKEQQTTQQLFDLMAMMVGSQQEAYAPYMSAIGAAATGD